MADDGPDADGYELLRLALRDLAVLEQVSGFGYDRDRPPAGHYRRDAVHAP